jgi:serine/threonine-protein kinase ATR
VRLQQSPDNVDFHLGLLRCLRNLGHYGKGANILRNLSAKFLSLFPDTLRTHVRGVLTRNPDWESALAEFQVESAWMVGAWDDVQSLVDHTNAQSSSIVMARLLLAMRAGESSAIAEQLSVARSVLGAPITAAGVKGYRRSYQAVLDLHLTHELEVIHNSMTSLSAASQGNMHDRQRQILTNLSGTLTARLDASLPTFRTREPLLSMRRTAFALM